MKDTEMRNTELCFPEFQVDLYLIIFCIFHFKNIYGKVFGGFLMREAVELAFICAKYFSKVEPPTSAFKMCRKSLGLSVSRVNRWYSFSRSREYWGFDPIYRQSRLYGKAFHAGLVFDSIENPTIFEIGYILKKIKGLFFSG